MPNCPTCRKEHVAPCGNNLFISVNIPCAITLEDVPSEQCWSLPCGHTFCKESLRAMGFSEKQDTPRVIERIVVREVVRNDISNDISNDIRNESEENLDENLQELERCQDFGYMIFRYL